MIFSLVRQMFRFAQDRDIIENDPTAAIRKAKIGGKDVERDRVLSDAEIRDLRAKLPGARVLDSTEIAVWLCLSTLCRIGELLRARWAEVDFDNRTWRIPPENSKNGKPHLIYLNRWIENSSGTTACGLLAAGTLHRFHAGKDVRQKFILANSLASGNRGT